MSGKASGLTSVCVCCAGSAGTVGAAAASGVAVLTNDVDTGDGVVTGGCCFFFNASWKYRMKCYTFCLFIYTFSRQYEIAIINEIRKIQVASVATDFIIANTAISSAHFFCRRRSTAH